VETALLSEGGRRLGNSAAEHRGINLEPEQREISNDTKVESSDPGEPSQPLLDKATKALSSVLLRNESSAMIKPQRSHKNQQIVIKWGADTAKLGSARADEGHPSHGELRSPSGGRWADGTQSFRAGLTLWSIPGGCWHSQDPGKSLLPQHNITLENLG